MAYTYDSLFAVDPNAPSNVARNASILLFDPNDATKTAVTLTDVTDSPLTNPVVTNQHGFGPAFKHATLDRLAWEGAGMSGVFTSYEGMKAEAVAARAAAETAAADAAAAASATTAVSLATIAASTYTLQLSDAGKEIETTYDGVVNVIVPPNSEVAFPVGTVISLRHTAATGYAVVFDGAGVTLRSPNGTKTAEQWSTISLMQRAANDWVLGGDLLPSSEPPLTPTIGAATASIQAAVVGFTPNPAGPEATSYVVTATPGGKEATAYASPAVVEGLTAGTAYTFTVRAVGPGGNSALSAASNTVTPTAATTDAAVTNVNLAAWYSADKITGAVDGGAVTYWPDNSGNARGLTQQIATKRPVLRTTSTVVTLPNSKPVVDFDGVADYLASVTSGLSAQPVRVFMVARRDGGAGTRVPLSAGGLTGPYIGSGGSWTIFAGAALGAAGDSASWHSYAARFQGSSSHIRQDGVQLTAGNAGTNVPNVNAITVGADAGGTASFWPGEIAEILVYAGDPTTAEITAIEGYLRTKYGTP